jgi:hypothetical protein
MKYNIDEKTLISACHRREAIIKQISNPTEDLIFKMVKKNISVWEHLTPEQRTPRIYAARLLSASYYGVDSVIKELTQEIWDAVPLEDRIEVIKEHYTKISEFPKSSYELWLVAVREGYGLYTNYCRDFKEVSPCLEGVPEEYMTEELILSAIGHDQTTALKIAGKYWTKSFIMKALKVRPEIFNSLPASMMSKDFLSMAFRFFKDIKSGRVRNNFKIFRDDIPEHCWTDELADTAINLDDNNFIHLPLSYQTKERALRVVTYNGSEKHTIAYHCYRWMSTDLKHDRDIILAYVSEHDHIDEVPVSKLTKSLAMDVAKTEQAEEEHPNFHALERWPDFASMAEDIIDEVPGVIRVIDKLNQTDRMVNAVINKLSIEYIDNLVGRGCICLTKLKKEHAPLLIGSTNEELQTLIARKLNPTPRSQSVVQTDPAQALVAAGLATVEEKVVPKELSYEVEMTPGEYKKFMALYKKEEKKEEEEV